MMAETKDYVSILLKDESWVSKDNAKTLENLKQALVRLGAAPNTPEFNTAFSSLLSIQNNLFKANANMFGAVPKGTLTPLEFAKTKLTTQEIAKMGIDPLATSLGRDVNKSWKSQSGELISGDDQFQRDRFGNVETDEAGNPLYRGMPGETLQDPKTNRYLRLSDLETVPEWFNTNNALPGFAEAGIVAGAKLTPEMRGRFKQLMGVTGAGTTGTGNGIGLGATGDGTGTDFSTKMNNPYAPGTPEFDIWEKKNEAQQKSVRAFDMFRGFLRQYGIEGLAADVEKYKLEGLSDEELKLRLRTESKAYKQRFGANDERIKKGLSALSEAAYIELEDQYQDVMRRYGLPESYYARGEMGRQEGFEKFIGGDVSPVELEDRISTAYNRVVNANPEVSKALREFYPEITGGDILAYALDPDKAINNIKRKVTAAEIGAGAMQAGLQTGLARAEELQRYGVTKETAQQGFGTIASGLERGRQLSNIYQQPDYTQQVAETEVFALPDADKARRQRRRLGQLETATFSGTSGVTGGALNRERAGQY